MTKKVKLMGPDILSFLFCRLFLLSIKNITRPLHLVVGVLSTPYSTRHWGKWGAATKRIRTPESKYPWEPFAKDIYFLECES
jgi:hypothetical protein